MAHMIFPSGSATPVSGNAY